MAVARHHHGWLRYNELDAPCRDLSGAFALGYRFIGEVGNDVWSNRFNGVKFASDGDTRYFNAAVALMRVALDALFRESKLRRRHVMLVPALGSSQTSGRQGNTMQRIATIMGKSLNVSVDTMVLTKKVHEPLHIGHSSSARREIVKYAGYRAEKIVSRYVFILDDYITTGTTLGAIATAIRNKNPNVLVYGVALAKNERRSFSGDLTNDHISKQWNRVWQEAFRR